MPEPCHAGSDELTDRGFGVSELGEQLLGMLAQHRRMAVNIRPVVVEQDRVAHALHAAEPRVLDVLHHAARDDMRIVEHFLEIVDPRARNAGREQGGLQLFGVAPPHRRLDDLQERRLKSLAARIGRKPRIADMCGEAEHLHQLGEERVVRRADGEIAFVARLEELIGRIEPVPVAERLRNITGGEIFGGLPRRRRDRGLDQRDIGDASLAVARGADQTRQRRVGRKQRAEDIRGLQPGPRRHLVGLAGHGERARERLDDEIDAGAPPVRAALPEARH